MIQMKKRPATINVEGNVKKAENLKMEEVYCTAVAKSFKGKLSVRVRIYKNLTGKSLKPGDLFVGRRNTGWELGVCSYVDPDGYVISSDENTYGFAQIYPYDNHEIRKVDKILSYTDSKKEEL